MWVPYMCSGPTDTMTFFTIHSVGQMTVTNGFPLRAKWNSESNEAVLNIIAEEFGRLERDTDEYKKLEVELKSYPFEENENLRTVLHSAHATMWNSNAFIINLK
jgi:hypothetical protein